MVRIGHAVLKSHRSRQLVQWYQETLGLLCSDEVLQPNGQLALSFNRVDRGEEYVDHHVLLIDIGPKAGINHTAYEICDLDDLMLGHEHLKAKGYENVWGVGRHVYGGQLFDYWMDPWEFMYEHWTDTDRVNAQFKGVLDGTPQSAAGPWGPDVPERFLVHAHAVGAAGPSDPSRHRHRICDGGSQGRLSNSPADSRLPPEDAHAHRSRHHGGCVPRQREVASH